MKQTVRRLFALFLLLRPPRKFNLVVLLISGAFLGLLAVTLHISRATSYLTDDPAACVNCHIMAPQYASWQRGSHGRFTSCNDCHVPQDLVRKYAFKAYDGTRHAFMFTFKLEPQVIQMHRPGQRVVQENCVRCHGDFMATTLAVAGTAHGGERRCWDCHREVPHGRVNSLASAPNARVPMPDPVHLPAWLSERLGGNTEGPVGRASRPTCRGSWRRLARRLFMPATLWKWVLKSSITSAVKTAMTRAG